MGCEMRKFIFVMLLAGTSNSGVAEWVSAGKSPVNDGNYDNYVDFDTVIRSGNKVTMWNMLDLKTAVRGRDGAQYLSERTQFEYDCEGNQFRGLNYLRYSDQMGHGVVVDSSGGKITNWTPTSPGSIIELNMKLACGKR
jgi:hypothetical protein